MFQNILWIPGAARAAAEEAVPAEELFAALLAGEGEVDVSDRHLSALSASRKSGAMAKGDISHGGLPEETIGGTHGGFERIFLEVDP